MDLPISITVYLQERKDYAIQRIGVCRELNRIQGILSGGICDSGFLEIEDA